MNDIWRYSMMIFNFFFFSPQKDSGYVFHFDNKESVFSKKKKKKENPNLDNDRITLELTRVQSAHISFPWSSTTLTKKKKESAHKNQVCRFHVGL